MATLPNPTASVAPAAPNRISIDTQHDDMIHDAQLDYYGTKLATSSSDRTVKVYDVISTGYTHTATLQGHTGPVWEVAWSHPKFGTLLASCSFDGSVMIHRETRPREWTLIHHARNLHNSSVNSVKFAPHEYGLKVVAASSDGRVSILSHTTNDEWTVQYIQDNALGVNAVDWSPYPLNRLVTAGCDNRIRFYDVQGNDTIVPIDMTVDEGSKGIQHSDWVRDVAWAPSIPGLNVVASCSEDKTVIIWTQKVPTTQSANSSAEESKDQETAWKATLLHTFDEPVWRVSWSLTGAILAVSSGDATVTLWKQTMDGAWLQVTSVEE
jgi:protein transport protein SEC13